MSNKHPMQPPLELLARHRGFATTWEDDMRAAYAAGADAQLEACVEWVQGFAECGDSLRAAMRPKPLSLKQQALDAIDRMPQQNETETIRRALEALPDDH